MADVVMLSGNGTVEDNGVLHMVHESPIISMFADPYSPFRNAFVTITLLFLPFGIQTQKSS